MSAEDLMCHQGTSYVSRGSHMLPGDLIRQQGLSCVSWGSRMLAGDPEIQLMQCWEIGCWLPNLTPDSLPELVLSKSAPSQRANKGQLTAPILFLCK